MGLLGYPDIRTVFHHPAGTQGLELGSDPGSRPHISARAPYGYKRLVADLFGEEGGDSGY